MSSRFTSSERIGLILLSLLLAVAIAVAAVCGRRHKTTLAAPVAAPEVVAVPSDSTTAKAKKSRKSTTKPAKSRPVTPTAPPHLDRRF